MTVSMYTLLVNDTLTKPLQAIYNLNWKHSKVVKPDGKQFTEGNVTIAFWPTAMAYTVGGQTLQVKWELHDHQVVNITFPHPTELPDLAKFLNKYLWG